MKSILITVFSIIAFFSCVNNNKPKENAAQKMSATLQSNVIQVTYDSLYIITCDTVITPIPYDSTYNYKEDSCYQKKRRFGGTKQVCVKLDRIGHATGYNNDTAIDCHTDTIKGHYDSIPPPPPSATQFGAKITNGTFAQQDNALKAMGVNVVRPNGITLSTWVAGSTSRLDDFLNAGYTCIVNVSWDEQTPNSVVPFYTNIGNYTTKFDALVKQYAEWGKSGKLIFAIENEEFNKGYFSGPIEDYISLFTAALNVCIKYDVPITDGALAEEYVNMIATNTISTRYAEQTTKISKLIAAFKSIMYSKFTVNVHRTFSGSSYSGTDILVACNYIRDQTGHQVLTNEYHLTDAQPSLLADIVQKWKDAEVVYSLILDESKAQGGAITDGSGNLTKLGTAFAAAIKN